MPSYSYWLISLMVHVMALSVVLPDSWFVFPSQAPALPSLKLVPPERIVRVPPPAGRPPQLSHVVRASAPKPALPRARVDRQPPPRPIRVATTAAQWTQLPPVVTIATAPKPKAKAPAKLAPAKQPPAPANDAAPASPEPASDGPEPASAGGPVASTGNNAAPAAGNEGSPGNGAGDGLRGDGAGDGPLGMPSYSQTPLPAYPRVAKLRGWEGVTVLRVEVREDGSVGHVELVRSSGHGVLDETAMKAVRAWRFEPARRGAAAVSCVIEVPVRFKLDSAGA